jgi:hypothetical protein
LVIVRGKEKLSLTQFGEPTMPLTDVEVANRLVKAKPPTVTSLMKLLG